jgi:oxalate decarboxylase/phosphoglucose isomerase-like protein (cupin superfamily)
MPLNRPIALILPVLVLLGATPLATQKEFHQHYPNIPGEVVFENDKVVVQRYVVKPGEWEGVHTHSGNQLYVHIKGGEWTMRYGDNKETSVAKDGSVGWMPKVTLAQDHESGNTGDTPIEFLWITLKQ